MMRIAFLAGLERRNVVNPVRSLTSTAVENLKDTASLVPWRKHLWGSNGFVI